MKMKEVCVRCARPAPQAGVLVPRTRAQDAAWDSVVCRGCGALLPPAATTARLVRKLSQLALFGLGGGVAMLLRASPQASRDM